MSSVRLLDTIAFEVGKFYKVPCIKTVERLKDGYRPYWCGEWVPVMGPLHRDVGPVNFPWLHWHVDLRFVSAKVYAELNKVWHGSPFATPLQKFSLKWETGGPQGMGERTDDSFVDGDVVERRLKCKRQFPAYPFTKAKWLSKLAGELKDVRMQGMVCPHRGIPLNGCPLDGDVVTCPGHGLRWNVKTGEVVTCPVI